jgi:putative addiction module killer protein
MPDPRHRRARSLVTNVLPLRIPIKVEEYIREDASIPYKQWFDGLSSQVAAKLTVAKLRMELGNISSIKWFDGMGEYVIDWGPGYRIYLAKDGDKLIVLLAAVPSVDSNGSSIKPKNYGLNTRPEKKQCFP